MRKPRPSKEELTRMYVEERLSTVKIAERLGVGSSTIRDWLKNEGIEIRSISEATSIAQLPERFTKPTKEELKRIYVNEKMSMTKTGENLGISRASVYNWLRENEIEMRDKSEARLPIGISKLTKEELERMYVGEGISTYKIGKRLGVSNSTILNWLREYDIKVREPKRLPEGLVKPSKEELKKMYFEERISTYKIAERLGANPSSVLKWLRENDIETREPPRLPEGLTKPSKEDLKKLYMEERLSVVKIAERLEVSHSTVCNWLRENKIEIRDRSEARLPIGISKPTKEELERFYVDEKMSAVKIGKRLGVGITTVYSWLRENEIEIRDISEAISIANLPEGFVKPSEEELEKMYIERKMSTYKISKELGVDSKTILKWLKKYEIPLRTNKISNSQFKDFLRDNQPVLNLAGAALLMSGERDDMESFILQTYQGTFKDREELHTLLDNNKQEIYSLIKEGITNLGQYIGNYTLDDRRIIPVLIDQAISAIGEDKITSSLEEKIVGLLRTQYSPIFNENINITLHSIETKIAESEGKVRAIYQRLHNHYREVLQLQEELR